MTRIYNRKVDVLSTQIAQASRRLSLYSLSLAGWPELFVSQPFPNLERIANGYPRLNILLVASKDILIGCPKYGLTNDPYQHPGVRKNLAALWPTNTQIINNQWYYHISYPNCTE
jgi:hypothetical protein